MDKQEGDSATGTNHSSTPGAIIGIAHLGPIIPDPDLGCGGLQIIDTSNYPYKNSSIPNNANFTASALSAQLGFPLKIASDPTCASKERNWDVHMLFAISDSISPQFGKAPHVNSPTGDAMLVRTDGKEMNYMQFEALHKFIAYQVVSNCMVFDQMPEGNVKETIKRRVAEKLTPEAFHCFFEEYRRHKIRIGQTSFKEAKSPVLVTFGEVEPACGACFIVGKANGPLSKCSKCKKTHYCGRECQKKDWKHHQKICNIE